jgi:hypothetical protein
MPNQTIVEVKMMQRHRDCDLNAMLLYVFFRLKTHIDLVLDEKFEKDFISKCIFCGCVEEQSGTNDTHPSVSYFIISKISFAIFIHHIEQYYKDDPDSKDEHYMEQIFVDILNALQNGLQTDKVKEEKVIIYDEKTAGFLKPQRYLDNDDSLRKFIKPLLKISERKISNLHKQQDNLLLLYNIVRGKISPVKDLKIFYTLYDNRQPFIPQTIRNKFSFCTLKYRKRYELCATKEYTKYFTDHLENINYIDFNDRLFKIFYNFVGLW